MKVADTMQEIRDSRFEVVNGYLFDKIGNLKKVATLSEHSLNINQRLHELKEIVTKKEREFLLDENVYVGKNKETRDANLALEMEKVEENKEYDDMKYLYGILKSVEEFNKTVMLICDVK